MIYVHADGGLVVVQWCSCVVVVVDVPRLPPPLQYSKVSRFA